MADTGTGTDPDTGRCPDCGHRLDRDCGCACCAVVVKFDLDAQYLDWLGAFRRGV